MVDESSRCPFCNKGFYVEEKGITSGTTAYFCNNCFKYKEEDEFEDFGSHAGRFHTSSDYGFDGWPN